MKTTTLMDFNFQDGKVIMHVRVTKYDSEYRPCTYRVSHSNSMRESTFTVEPFDDENLAMSRAYRLRSECYGDVGEFLKSVM